MPEQVPLTQGSYLSRSVIANAQRCVNLYCDINAKDSPFPFTFYPTPGQTIRWSPPVAAPARGQYTASNGDLYYCVGRGVYYISPNYVGTHLGDLTTAATPVSMKDNGQTLVIVDGTTSAFLVNLATRVMTPYADPNFLGSDRVDYLDGFLLYNQPNTRNFYTTLLNTTNIDATYIAAKSAGSDDLSRVVCIERLAYLMGRITSEVWGNAGAPSFPFQEVPGAFMQHGIVAPYSVATHDNAVYFVEQNKDGKGVIAKASGYIATRVSTPAIEAEMAKYPTLTDAVGFCYAMLGHVYYVVTFPSADITWSFDLSMPQPIPHQWAWTDGNGLLHRHRAAVATYAYGLNFTGDWENGNLYELNSQVYNDFGGVITHVKGFPHLVRGGRLCEFQQFQAEMEVGQDLPPDVLVSLRISASRGKAFSMPMTQPLSSVGDYLRVPQWRQLGMARDMVFELEWGFDASSALNGGYVDYQETDA